MQSITHPLCGFYAGIKIGVLKQNRLAGWSDCLCVFNNAGVEVVNILRSINDFVFNDSG